MPGKLELSLPGTLDALSAADLAARYPAIFAAAAIGMVLIAPEGQLREANPALGRLLGYPPAAISLALLHERTHPDDPRLTVALAASLLAASPAPEPIPQRYLHRDGHLVWVLLSLAQIDDPEGRPTCYIAQFQDVTALRQIEQALHGSEERFRRAFDLGLIGMAISGPSKGLLAVNDTMCAILGYERHELLAVDWANLTHPDDLARDLAQFDRVMAGEIDGYTLDKRWIRMDGQIVDSIIAVRALRHVDGSVDYFVAQLQDVTEQKRAEQALRRSERLYRMLARNFPNGTVALVDHNLRYCLVDGQALQVADFTRQQLEGRALAEVLPPDMFAVHEPIFRAVLAGSERVHEDQMAGHSFVTYYLPVRDEQGAIEAALAVSHDITALKQAEAALEAERSQLAQRVEERTAELHTANLALAQAARMKDAFLASMSHELRTPLNAVLGNVELLGEQIYGPLGERQHHALQQIDESARHLLALINDILDVAKIGAGAVELEQTPCDLAQIGEASLRMVREAASKKQLRVQFAYDPQLTWVLADGRRLKQILVNLLANAVKFTPVGGSVGLDVGADPVADVIHLEVWDTGIGIAPEACNQLFQPFVQLDSRLSREYAGTGLGLALVKQLSELHGGSVTVVSEVGVGSRFRVTLPWCRVGAPEQVGAETGGREAAAVTLATGATILLADDDDANSAVITDYLTAVGYQVVQAHDGREALRLAAEVQPALILMDIQMPRLEGLVAIQHLRATPAYTTTPIIALTALAMPEDRERCLAAGADDYFAKPVRLRTLRDTIAGLLRTRASMT